MCLQHTPIWSSLQEVHCKPEQCFSVTHTYIRICWVLPDAGTCTGTSGAATAMTGLCTSTTWPWLSAIPGAILRGHTHDALEKQCSKSSRVFCHNRKLVGLTRTPSIYSAGSFLHFAQSSHWIHSGGSRFDSRSSGPLIAKSSQAI